MDPDHQGSEEQDSGAVTRVVPLTAGEYLLTVNPVDGSEIEPCPPGRHPGVPRRRAPESRAECDRATLPPVPVGVSPDLPLLERTAERERLVQLLRQGRSVRLTGPPGSGRTALLAAVAADCAGLAPDGVIRLSGCHRTAGDLMQELFATVHDAPGHRPDGTELADALRGIGAVVLLDDIEFGGQGLDSLLDATPECAFLISAAPDTPAPSPDAHLEEVALSGISRSACRALMEHIVRRPLTEEEMNWAADLWFESEGLPLRFVQAGALLRQRDTSRAGTADADGPARTPDGGTGSADEGDVPGTGSATEAGPGETGRDGGQDGCQDGGRTAGGTSLPTLAEGAAPAPLLAARLSGATREVLRFAVALGGVLPHPAHLPALVGDPRADEALGELLACGLATAAGAHHRLAPGVTGQLTEAGYAEGAEDRAHTAARHYAWWTGHPSVTPGQVAQEAEAVLAAVQGAQRGGQASAAVLLARTAAPVLAASLYWSAWERMLRGGQEAARTAGEVAEEAYFHHDLGVLALCTGRLDRARVELEASIGLRGVLADRRGTVAGRRALALVEDRSAPRADGGPGALSAGPSPLPALPPAAAVPPVVPSLSDRLPVPSARPGPSVPPPAATGPRTTGGTPALDGLPAALTVPPVTVGSADDETYGDDALTRPTPSVAAAYGGGGGSRRGLALLGARRNALAAGAGALLAVAVGAVVTLGMTSGSEPAGGVNPTFSPLEDEGITVNDSGPGAEKTGEKTPGPSGTPSGSGTPSAGTGAPGVSPSSQDSGSSRPSTGPREEDEEGAGGATGSSGGGSRGTGDGDSSPSGGSSGSVPGGPGGSDSSGGSGSSSGNDGGTDSGGDDGESEPPSSTPPASPSDDETDPGEEENTTAGAPAPETPVSGSASATGPEETGTGSPVM
ncbi:ATP-binding protein [Streptomyces sp. TRM 70361]|uniref:ATP-binding protein n=1 Tax=Streptomyces sp. TRM 70361 TaxID=3116553 RepID=UPI002E7C50E2|nr:ATP-binding protein [Streptomyces sp. TRM 70361]MEE1938743.1 ATP-binding protein [Streptomyces sp. TRM 70361]